MTTQTQTILEVPGFVDVCYLSKHESGEFDISYDIAYDMDEKMESLSFSLDCLRAFAHNMVVNVLESQYEDDDSIFVASVEVDNGDAGSKAVEVFMPKADEDAVAFLRTQFPAGCKFNFVDENEGLVEMPADERTEAYRRKRSAVEDDVYDICYYVASDYPQKEEVPVSLKVGDCEINAISWHYGMDGHRYFCLKGSNLPYARNYKLAQLFADVPPCEMDAVLESLNKVTEQLKAKHDSKADNEKASDALAYVLFGQL